MLLDSFIDLIKRLFSVFRCIHASLYEGLSVGGSVRGPLVGQSVVHCAFFLPQKLSVNSIEILEKLKYGSLPANNLRISCK